jgi:phosphotransacetylase
MIQRVQTLKTTQQTRVSSVGQCFDVQRKEQIQVSIKALVLAEDKERRIIIFDIFNSGPIWRKILNTLLKESANESPFRRS